MSGTPMLALAEFCQTGSGGTPNRSISSYYGGSIPWVKSGELREATIFDTEEKITDAGLRGSSAKIVPRGSILLAMYGATVGRLAFLGIDAATNQAICSIAPDPTMADARYVFHGLQARLSHFLSRAAGGAQPNISQAIVRETRLPLPQLGEQRRIAAVLDKADALRRKRKRALDLLDNLTQSIFLEMFGDPAENPKNFPRGRIGDLLDSVQYGTSEKASATGAFPILRMGNITTDGKIDLSDLKFIDLADRDIQKYTVMKGDILFNRTNSAELVGKTAVFDQNKPCAFAGYLVRARAKSGVSPDYVSGYLNSAHGKATLRGMAKSIVGMANINAREMQSIPILIPDAASQENYDSALAKTNEQIPSLLRNRDEMNALFASLQSRAFSGQL